MKHFCVALFISGVFLLFANADSNATSMSCFLSTNNEIDNSVTNVSIDDANSIFAEIDDQNSYTDHFSVDDANVLPVGIKKTIGNNDYTIAFSKISYHDKYAELTVWGRISIPQKGDGESGTKELMFVGDKIKYTVEGGIESGAKLMLIEDTPVKILGDKATLMIKGANRSQAASGVYEGNTYISFDCEGFKELSVDVDILFSRSLIKPVDTNGKITTGQVNGHFQTVVADWSDILMDLTLPNFAVNGIDGFSFSIQKAVFDFSDRKNSGQMSFPDGYDQYLISGNEALWKGVFIQDMVIHFPDEFKSKKTGKGISAEVKGLLIDEFGVSGLFSLSNILPLSEGTASGWSFSVETFKMGLIASQLSEVGFTGELVLPISDTTSLGYTAILSESKWLMSVKTEKKIDFNLWAAKITVDPSSSITFKEENGNFLPEANLNGYMSVSAEKIVNIDHISFQDLHLKTTGDKFSIGYLGYDGEAKLNGFPITISNIAATTSGDEIALACDVNLNLDEKVSQGFSATGGVRVLGTMDRTSGISTAKYKGCQVDQFKISADLNAVKIKGNIEMLTNDATYGNGFSGDIEMIIGPVLKSTIRASAIFGKTSYRYWVVDGLVSGMRLGAPPGFTVTGFGGGISSRMKQTPLTKGSQFPSGINYVPDDDSGVGLIASIMFSMGEKAVTGEAGFSIIFNRNGGLNRIGVFGEARMAANLPVGPNLAADIQEKLKGISTKIEEAGGKGLSLIEKTGLLECSKKLYPKSPSSVSTGIRGKIGIDYDFTSSTLHGNFDVYISTPGNILRGRGAEDRAGWAVYHSAPDCWYLHVGHPDDRLGLITQIGPVKVESGGYFMIGDELPPFPDPPQRVLDIFSKSGLQYDRGFDLSAFGTGRGICFGTDFSISTGDIAFLFLFARFDAGLGFDVMLQDYGTAHCVGESNPIGLNGWYAMGQAYAYLYGKLGLRIKIFGIKKKLTILEGATAALLKAGLPDPIWFEGYLAGNYKLLGGAVKGKYKFKLSIGNKCEIEGTSPLDGMKVIADITPSDGENNIDVFSSPQVVFNLPVNKEINIGTDGGEDLYVKVLLDEINVTTEDGQRVAGTLSWNDDQDILVYNTNEIMPEQQKVIVNVTVSFMEKENGGWKIYKDSNGNKSTEKMNVTFTTGAAPNYIPLNNIAYMYPVVDQKNCFIGETEQGFIKLKKGQPNILPVPANYNQRLVFIPQDGSGEIDAKSASSSSDLITFELSNVLKTGTDYVLSVNNVPNEEMSQGAYTKKTETTNLDENNTVEITNKEATGNVLSSAGYEIINFGFRTSQYKTWAKKIKSIRVSDVDYLLSGYNGGVLKADINNIEVFDKTELEGSQYTGNQPLIIPEVLLTDAYYNKSIKPLLYANYPLKNLVYLNRTDNIPPVDGILVQGAYYNLASSHTADRFPYLYTQFKKYYSDFHLLRDKAADVYDRTNEWFPIISKQFPGPGKETYKIKLKYRLPNGIYGTEETFNYKY